MNRHKLLQYAPPKSYEYTMIAMKRSSTSEPHDASHADADVITCTRELASDVIR